MNFGRKMMKAGVAAVAAIATLGAGGVVASTAFAGGGGGNQPGTGGDRRGAVLAIQGRCFGRMGSGHES